jgi:PAS domain S-box-containing protein
VPHWFRQRLGLTFSAALALILAVALAGIGGAVHARLAELDAVLSSQNEQTVRGQATLLLARATQDEADHLNAVFLKFESFAMAVAAQTGFLLEHAEAHLSGPEAVLRLRPQADGRFLDADANGGRSPASYWGGTAPSEEALRNLRALGHLQPLLERFLASEPLCDGAWFVGAQGYGRLFARRPVEARRLRDHDPRERSYYTLASPEQDPGRDARWTGVLSSEYGGVPLVAVVAPVYSRSGAFLGVTGLNLPLASIAAHAFNRPHPSVTLDKTTASTRFTDEFSLLAGPEGEVLAVRPQDLAVLGLPAGGLQGRAPGEALRLNLQDSENPEVRNLAADIRGRPGGQVRLGLGGAPWVVFHHPIPCTGWSLCQFVPEAGMLAPLAGAHRAMVQAVDALNAELGLISLAFLAAALTAVILFFRYLLLRPLARVREGFADLASGDLDARLDENLPGELGLLARSFNETAASLAEWHQAALRAERRYREIFENAVNGVYQSTPQGRMVRVNPAMARMFGYESPSAMREQVQNFSLQHYLDPREREELLAQARERGEIRGRIIGFRRRDGARIWGSVNARAVYDADGEMALIEGTVEDITERRQAEEERLALNQQLTAMNEQLTAMNEELSAANEEMASTNEELVQTNDELVAEMALRRESEERLVAARRAAESASRAKSEFLANMSHEIRTPLNAIMGMLQLLARSGGIGGEEREYAEIALVSAKSLLSVINDILDLSAVEAGKMTLVEEAFEPAMLARQVADAFGGEARNKGLALSLDICPETPQVLVGDPGRLRQILFNLLGNAVKFTDRGSVGLEICVLGLDQERPRLLISVSDTGIGIAPDNIRHVFEPFTQADGSLGRRYQGTGLGLGIVKRLAELMGGSVAMESELGQGTSVHLVVPTALPGPALKLARERRRRSSVPGPRLRVLVAEDRRINRILVVRVLEKLGHRAVEAHNGREALSFLAEQQFDLLLLDVQMPEVDGLEVTRRVREGRDGVLDRTIPIIAMTAHAMKGDRELFLEAGMDGYIAKPFELDQFSEVLREVLAGEG